jgi:protein-S-isoprenylcysteine O-methyltransferase Ste14
MSVTKAHLIMARTVGAAILLGLPILSHYLFPITSIVPKPYTYCGMVLMLLGLALGILTAITFRRFGASYQLHGKSPALATSGPFRISRNPMYLGMLSWLAGMAILLGSVTPFLFPILLFLAATFAIIPLEEHNMEKVFGERYLEYKQHVRRWL